jgi:hypothetical protein
MIVRGRKKSSVWVCQNELGKLRLTTGDSLSPRSFRQDLPRVARGLEVLDWILAEDLESDVGSVELHCVGIGRL